jgi:hypothetical protein
LQKKPQKKNVQEKKGEQMGKNGARNKVWAIVATTILRIGNLGR